MSVQPMPSATGVFRGLHLEPAPLRLGRAAAPASRLPAPPAQPDAQEESLRLARDHALREGREQGLRAGQEEGLRQGRATAAAETRAAVDKAVAEALQAVHAERDRLRQLAGAMQGALDGLQEAAHDEMVALCYETICRVIGAAAVRPDTVRSQLSHLVALYGARAGLVLHVHPQDAALLEHGADDGAPATLRWTADPEVALGGCILRCAAGGLDARLETMLASCKEALLEARAARTQAPASGGEGA